MYIRCHYQPESRYRRSYPWTDRPDSLIRRENIRKVRKRKKRARLFINLYIEYDEKFHLVADNCSDNAATAIRLHFADIRADSPEHKWDSSAGSDLLWIPNFDADGDFCKCHIHFDEVLN